MLNGKHVYVLGFLLALVGGCAGPDLVSVTEPEIRGREIQPYAGLIRNFSAYDISIPSEDSSSTLILPARGQLEYTVWKPDVKLFGYIDGIRVYYKSLRVEPKKYTFMGKTYDFLAEVCPELPAPIMIPQQCPSEPEPEPKKRKKRRVCPS
jgi:hypothetical protein